jgi:hypothetical protein
MIKYSRLIKPMNERKKKYFNVMIEMRDGVKLATDIYFPAGEGPFATLLIRTSYNKAAESEAFQICASKADTFNINGYAVVVQDVRGRGDSNGEWIPFFNEDLDGYDTVEWIGIQSWCDGNVGMWGISYLGFTAKMAARLNPPHLKAIFIGGEPDLFCEGGGFYMNNIPQNIIFHWLCMTNGHLNQIAVTEYSGEDTSSIDLSKIFTTVPTQDMDFEAGMHIPFWHEGMRHLKDDYWKRLYMDEYYKEITVPAFHITGWYDTAAHCTIYSYIRMANEAKSKDHQYLMVGPWERTQLIDSKNVVYGIDYGENAIVDIHKLEIDFFEYYLKKEGNFEQKQPKEMVFALRENQWHTDVVVKEWLKDQKNIIKLYLNSEGDAKTLNGNGKLELIAQEGEKFDEYYYNPLMPTPSHERWTIDSLDGNWIMERSDTLVYTSEVMTEELRLAGYPKIKFYASTDCKDTDFMVSLYDVYEDGKSIDICGLQPAIRGRYKDSLEYEKLLEPNKIHEYNLDLIPSYNVFKTGHRIRIVIKSAHFPSYARNHNTGNDVLTDVEFKVACNRIYYGIQNPTQLILPIIDKTK